MCSRESFAVLPVGFVVGIFVFLAAFLVALLAVKIV
jgi:hypothetical protein